MPTTNGNRKILDLKRWEFLTPAPVATVAGSHIISSRHYMQQQLYIQSATVAYLYLPSEDGFVQLPSPALNPAISAGSAGTSGAISVGTAVGGTTIAAGSNGQSLPQATINVSSTTGFPAQGAFYIDTSTNGRQLITYTSVPSATQFGGCSNGSGILATNQVVSFAGLLALSGNTNQIMTSQLLARNLSGYSIHIMSGPNSGSTIEIKNNTTFVGTTTIASGSNGQSLPQATINVATTIGFPQSGQILIRIGGADQIVVYTGITSTSFLGCSGGSGNLATSQAVQFASVLEVANQNIAFNSSTVFRLITPIFYVNTAGTLTAGSFRKYCFATNTWTTLSITGLPATLGTDCRQIHTTPWEDNAYLQFSTGTTTSATTTTLTDSIKNWAINQWSTAYQIRIVSGTGAGQIRPIVSNTSTSLIVSGWNIIPDNTSTYSIEGNEDHIYLMGNASVALYRYSISNNSWVLINPNVPRSGSPGAGLSASWVRSVSNTNWSNENEIINGRRIYSFRGGGVNTLDYYDIPSNTWVSSVGYAPNGETFTTGSKWIYRGDSLYIQKDATGRWFRFDFPTAQMIGVNTMTYPQSTAVVGDTAFDVTYKDGTTEITYIYILLNSLTVLLRQMII
jgi:hypothetical protein